MSVPVEEDQAEQLNGTVIECRSSAIADVNFAERIITTIAVPYEQPASVPFGRPGEVWQEIFSRSAFAELEKSPHRVRVNRDHNKSRTVGKVIRFDPNSTEGLIAETRMAKTALGDETLALAADDCLGASVGFSCRASGQQLDRMTRTRRISAAYLDHLSFVESPAYDGAHVLSVRDDNNTVMTSSLALPPPTPALDQFLADPVFKWVRERLNSSKP